MIPPPSNLSETDSRAGSASAASDSASDDQPFALTMAAFETATDRCAVAVRIGEKLVVELSLDRPRSHAEHLVPLLADALRYAELEPGDLDVIAVSAGPGSYTGLRIGASTAKGLALAVEAKLVAVPSLEALAHSAREAIAGGGVLVAAFDARRDEVFAAAYRSGDDGSLETYRETSAVSIDEFASWIGPVDADLVLAGDGAGKIVRSAGGRIRILSEASAHPSAAWVAHLAAKRFSEGRVVDPSAFEPFYLKDFVAKRPAASAFEKLPF